MRPGLVLAALGVRRHPLTGAFRPPAEATVRRVLARVDPDALDRAVGAWLASSGAYWAGYGRAVRESTTDASR
jgi:hypothetical protein